jgi:multidrug efflux pump subunit AcrB
MSSPSSTPPPPPPPPPEQHSGFDLTAISVRKPVLAWMIMAAAILFGGVAASRIGISQFPDVDFPTISVNVAWEGASPEVIESDVVEPIEESLTQIEGIKSISSVARQGSGSITLELNLDREVDVALQDVQTRVAQLGRALPTDIDPPIVSKTNPEDQPIMWIAVSGPYSRQLLSDLARYRLKEELQKVPGVGEIFMGGYLARSIRVWLDADKLDAHGLTVTDVIAALRRQHVELPAGLMETEGREVNVRVMGEAIDLATLRGLVVQEDTRGRITLSDVALVEDGFEDARRLSARQRPAGAGTGHQEAARLQRGGRGPGRARQARRAPQDAARGHGGGRQLRLHALHRGLGARDRVRAHAGGHPHRPGVLAVPRLLVVHAERGAGHPDVACWARWRVIYFLGFTLNTFTLLALGLAVGIVVDDAIMVLENI